MNSYLSTNISALDALLGGRGFLTESTILLKGKSGTGKSTLALQLAQAAVTQGYYVQLVSVEQPPSIAFSRITQSLWGQDYASYLGLSASQAVDLTSYWASVDKSIEDYFKGVPQRPGIGFHPVPSNEAAMDEDQAKVMAEALRKTLLLDEVLGDFWSNVKKAASAGPLFVIVDSLSDLISTAQMRFREFTDRQMFLAIIRSFEAWQDECDERPTVLFTAEETTPSFSSSAESYISDIVLRLWREERKWRAAGTREDSVERREELLFCKVLKGRGLPIQTRACCYEFQVNAGLRFFPTYAAEGTVSLFFESSPLRQEIVNFRDVDAVSSYPGVIIQEFTRSGLQRMFSVRRHAENMPIARPLELYNVDEYWMAELRKANLLHAIPSAGLILYSLENAELISELEDAKGAEYREEDHYLAIPHWLNVGMLIYRRDILETIGASVPKTWDDVESICMQLQQKGEREQQPLPHLLLLETQTYDSLMATIMELAWGNRATLDVSSAGREALSVRFEEEGGFGRFCASMRRLHKWIHETKIVPTNSSVDPQLHPQPDWVFARHWYSTWVDYRTRRKPDGNLVSSTYSSERFGVTRIPVFDKSGQGTHSSAWGEWYLAVQRGSENVELGVDLIQNLLTARKVVERAWAGAGLPAMEKFYETHGEQICPYTDQTFNSIRKMFFARAKSRTAVFNYRRVVRVLAGPVHAVLTNPDPDLEIERLFLGAFRELDRNFRE